MNLFTYTLHMCHTCTHVRLHMRKHTHTHYTYATHTHKYMHACNVCTCTHTHTHYTYTTHTLHTYMHVCMYAHTLHICHTHTHTHIHARIYIRAHTHTCMHTHAHTHLNVCVTKHVAFDMEVKHILVPWKVGLSQAKSITWLSLQPLLWTEWLLDLRRIQSCAFGGGGAWWSYGDMVEICVSYWFSLTQCT
jgi:hypothetical protein